MTRWQTILAAASACAVLVAGGAHSQDKKNQPPQEDPEIRMGREAHEEMLKGGLKLVTDAPLQARVEAIGKKLGELANKEVFPATYGTENKTPYNYRFFIVDDPDVNAFSLPGGYLYVNKGLLKYVQSDDELAGVLAHEVIHAAHHHVARLQKEQNRLNTQVALGALAAILARVPMNDTGNLLTGFQLVALQKVNGYGQDAERDADRAGIFLARKAGYNPVGMLTFMERLGRDQKSRPEVELGIYRTHPPEKERASAMIQQIHTMGLPINRRETASILKVTTAAKGPAMEVLLDGKVFFRTASPERAKQIASALDALLNEDLRIYDVASRGGSITVRGQVLAAYEPADLALSPDAGSAEALAKQACKVLQLSLYRYVLDGSL